MRRSLLFAAVVAVFISGFVLAQTSFGHIDGVVRDGNGRPIPGVQLVLSGDNSFRRVTLSGETGEFWFRDVGPGTYSIVATLIGFLPAKVSAVVASGFMHEVTIALASAPAAAPVAVYDSALMQSARAAGVA